MPFSKRPRYAVLPLLATLSLGGSLMPAGPAFAQTAASAVSTEQQFSIPAGSLDSALNALANEAGLALVIDGSLTRDKTTSGLSGQFTVFEALGRLLEGTGLTYRITGQDTIAIEPAVQNETTALAPLMVYGARTTQALEDVAASVRVIDEQTLEQRQVGSVRESLRLAANVNDSAFNDDGFVIRGINSEGLTPGGLPLASLYIDGIQQTVQGARRGTRGVWDASQVEIYRGPQSTLAGRAALAGAIYLRTNDPTYEQAYGFKAGVGNDQWRTGAVMANLPIVDGNVAWRIAAEYETSESDLNFPDYRNFDRFDDYRENEYYQIRNKLLVEPDQLPGTRFLLTHSYAEDSPDVNDIGGPALGFDYDERRGDFNTPNFAEVRRTKIHNLGLEVTHPLADGWILTWESGMSDSETDRPSINEGTAGETDVVRGDFDQRLVTQEVRLNQIGETVESTLGLYLADERQEAGFRRPDFFGFASDISESEQDLRNYAVFGEVTYEFVPRWRAVVGGRLDYTEQEGSSFFSRNGNVTTDFAFDTDETEFLPKVGVLHDLTPDQTLGLTIQKGFRPGGSGVQRSSGEVFEYEAETAWNYELSYKAWLLNDAVSLSANLFYLDYKDQQIETLEDPAEIASSRITNSGESRARGVEVDVQADLNEQWSGFVSAGYVDTEFKDFNSAGLGDLSGLSFPEAPPLTAAVGLTYEHPSGFFAGGDVNYNDEFQARIGQPPQEKLDSYTLVNAQVGYRYGNWTATVFAENLFDEEYFLYDDNDIAATLGDRRAYGVVLEAQF